MIKKLVLLFISLFLISPIAFADDSSIIPVAWLFTKNNKLDRNDWADWYKIFENNSFAYKYGSHRQYVTPIESFKISDGIIYEYGSHRQYVTPIKSFKISDGIIYEYGGDTQDVTPIKSFKIYDGIIYEYGSHKQDVTPIGSFKIFSKNPCPEYEEDRSRIQTKSNTSTKKKQQNPYNFFIKNIYQTDSNNIKLKPTSSYDFFVRNILQYKEYGATPMPSTAQDFFGKDLYNSKNNLNLNKN